MKIIAFYLPQFHTFPENDEWWGEGFTEWVNVTKALPSFQGHYQPREPLNDNYYDLTDIKNIEWQSDLAIRYGIYGFCYYHYWFDGKMLMQKPMEMMLEDKNIPLKFCICWANENWTQAWARKSKKILIGQTYGNKEDWKYHFMYLLPFFKDERYIKVNGKPFFIIYRPELIPTLTEMIAYWQDLAAENGIEEICFAYQQVYYNHKTADTGELFDYGIEYQPSFVRHDQIRTVPAFIHKTFNELINRLSLKQTLFSTIHYSYDDTWKRILSIIPRDEKMIPGAFVDWDNTPRYKKKASVVVGYTPEKFKKYLIQQIIRAKEIYHKDMLFMFAWNEWGEGGYLEPDKRYRYKALEAIKEALKETNEYPER